LRRRRLTSRLTGSRCPLPTACTIRPHPARAHCSSPGLRRPSPQSSSWQSVVRA